MRRSALQWVALNLAVTIAYFAAGKLGLKLAFVNASATAVWPPTGIAMATALAFGPRIGPGVFLGAFLTNVTTIVSAATAFGIATGNTIEALLGAFLVYRFARGRRAFEHAPDVFRFVVYAAFIPTTISATIGVASLCFSGSASWSAFGSVWTTWWIGDAMGALLFMPFLLAWNAGARVDWTARKIAEGVVLLSGLVVMALIMSGFLLQERIGNAPLGFATIPFLLWAAFRFSPREAFGAAFILFAINLAGTLAGHGQFSGRAPNASLLFLQGFSGFTTVMTLFVSAVVTCHMESTSAPPALANRNADGSYGGTNHTFFASNTICAKCHTSINLASVQAPFEAKMDALKAQIETAIKNVMQAQIRAGNTIDLGGQKSIRNASDIQSIEFIESHGRQGVNVTLTGGAKVNDLSLATVKVVRPAGAPVELYSLADPALGKAGWNYLTAHSDGSKGVHNPGFVSAALDVSLFAVQALNTALVAPPKGPGGANPAAIGGGLGNGAGAVSCTSQYVYWSEMAGHTPGAAGSQWRTDLVARNLESSTANVRFILHQASGNVEKTGTIAGNSQRAFEDVTASFGESNKGSLEICSDRPLLVLSRVFNQAESGTFGQNLDGRVADLGYSAGQTISLIGLRQKADAYRSNLVVANGGTTEAEVAIILFDSSGKSLNAYNLKIAPGAAVQDGEPFKYRANAPDVDWGFATVTVLKGTNVITSASMIDMKTNDPTTIPAKQ